MEQSNPDHNSKTVYDAQRTGQKLVRRSSVLCSLNDHSDTKGDANDGNGNEPSCVMDEPAEVKAKLLPKVVLDEVKWLHVLQESSVYHAKS